MGEVMDILMACENQLGWVPQKRRGEDIYKARAVQHKILSTVMDRQRITARELRLAIAYCRRQRIFIDSPLQLFAFVDAALDHATPEERVTGLERDVEIALAWEMERSDDQSPYWRARLTRAQGPYRRDVLLDWAGAGRGEAGAA